MKKLKELGMDDEFGMYYDAEIVHRKEVNSAEVNSARSEGRKEGRKEGASNEKNSIAKSMLAKKMDIPLISELTGLSKKQITMLM